MASINLSYVFLEVWYQEQNVLFLNWVVGVVSGEFKQMIYLTK